MSGSFKKASKAHQRIHRERSQLSNRKHLGFLEKHKDYSERARDHNKKQAKIKVLQKKAADRNKDEFYFNMVNTERVDGVHRIRPDKVAMLTEEQLLLQQSEDLHYLIMKRTSESRKAERLQAELHLLDPSFRRNKHIVFVDKDSEVDTAVERVHRHADELWCRLTDLQQQEMDNKYGELARRLKRVQLMTVAIEKLEVTMHLAKGKGDQKKLVSEETKLSAAVYEWSYKRKR